MNRRKRIHETLASLPITPEDKAFSYHIPTTDDEWKATERLKKRDANDLAAELGREGVRKWLDSITPVCTHRQPNGITSLRTMFGCYKTLREPVIDGLLRRSELANIIAAPKMGKSWLTGNLALNIVTGGDFLGRFKCTQGRVLILDNELHCETITDRYRSIAKAMNISQERAGRFIDILPLRGRLIDVEALDGEVIQTLKPRMYTGIIMDSFYKFFPISMDGGKQRFDENSNAMMSRIYSVLETYADYLDCGIFLIHHLAKGNNSAKSVTDLGAGAGVLSRACDAHIVLRPHEEFGVAVVDAANRSFPPIEPFCARFKYPVWSEAKGLDPTRLLGVKEDFGSRRVGSNSASSAPDEGESTKLDQLLEKFKRPVSIRDILGLGKDLGIKRFTFDHVKRYVVPAWIEEGKMVLSSEGKGNRGALFARTEQSIPNEDLNGKSDQINQKQTDDLPPVSDGLESSVPWSSDESVNFSEDEPTEDAKNE